MEGLTMNNELVGQMILFFVISLILGSIGFVQYKSDIPFNVNNNNPFNARFNKQGYDLKIVSKIVGLHIMILALFLFIIPIIFYQFKDFKYAQIIDVLIMLILSILTLLSINIQSDRRAKLSLKAIKKQ